MYESDRGSDRSSTHPAIAWITRHPILFWGGLWTVALSVTIGVTVGLLHAERFAPRESSNIPPALRKESLQRGDEEEFEAWSNSREPMSVRDTNQPSPTPKPFFSLWLIGVISASCAVGSLFVTLVLKSLSFSQTPAKRLQPVRLSQKLPSSSMPRFQTQFGATPYQPPIVTDMTETRPRVTVLPPEAITPLDSPERDGNLLEQLDLR
ncbi:MAG: hypothetical protein AB4290_11035, partial [Spirulina sp.]